MPLEVDIQLPAGESLGHAVRPVDGQRGLADPGHSGDRCDHHRTCHGQQAVQPGQVVRTAGEPHHVGRQLGGGRPRTGERQLTAQNLGLHVAQLQPGLEPELFHQPAAYLGEQVQRGRSPPGAGQGEHEAGVCALVQRLLRGQRPELFLRPLVQPRGDREVGVGEHRVDVAPGQGHRRRVLPQPSGQIGQHRPAPARQRLGVEVQR